MVFDAQVNQLGDEIVETLVGGSFSYAIVECRTGGYYTLLAGHQCGTVTSLAGYDTLNCVRTECSIYLMLIK